MLVGEGIWWGIWWRPLSKAGVAEAYFGAAACWAEAILQLFFLISIPDKEMGDSASPRAAAAAPCGLTLCFFVLAIF